MQLCRERAYSNKKAVLKTAFYDERRRKATKGEEGLAFHLDYRASAVVPAMLANVVRTVKFATVGTDGQLRRLQCVVCAPPVAATLGVLSFR